MGGGARGGGIREAKVGDENKQTPKPNRKKRAGAQTEYRRRKWKSSRDKGELRRNTN